MQVSTQSGRFQNVRLRGIVAFATLVIALIFQALAGSHNARAQQQRESSSRKAPSSSADFPVSEAEEEGLSRLFPIRRELWFEQQRAFPDSHIPHGAYWHAQQQKRALVANRRRVLTMIPPAIAAQSDPFSSVTWTPDGPAPVYSSAVYPNPPSGRATSIAVHPTDPNTVYLGTAAGGVWKTTDGGQTWVPITDSQASLAIGAVAIDPNNPSTIYAGTGEPDFSGDSYYGQGLLKSNDSGATWTLIRAPFTTGDTAPDFTSIAVQPGNSNVVLAGNFNGYGQSGLFRTADGGNTWTRVLSPGGFTGVTAVMFDVKDPTIAYAGIGGYYSSSTIATASVYKSTDSGQTWTSIAGSGTTGVPLPSAVLRTALTETSDGKTLFAAFANSNFSAPGTIYSTTNSGTSWTQIQVPNATVLDWYSNAIAVSPTNSSVLFIAGSGLYQSIDGGQTWSASNQVYPDEHGFAFSADGTKMYVADDGGIYVTATPTIANPPFSAINETLNTLTFYPGFSLVPGQANSLLAGSQDHGLNLYTGTPSAWESGDAFKYCGDGGSAYIDPQGKFAYAHCWGGAANWIANSTGESVPSSWQSAQAGIGAKDRVPWVVDIKGDQQNTATVYTATNYLYQSTDSAGSWTAISPDLTAGNSAINTIGVSPSDSNTIYTGAGDGTVSVTNNALAGTSATWKTLTGLPNRSITKILVQPDSKNDVYLTVGGFDSGHVFHSTNAGASWTDISGDLPNTPVNSILLDQDLLNTIYVATDIGVFVTTNGGTNWTPLGQGLPNVVVFDILMYLPTHTLRVVTHGRGAWDAVVPMVGLQSSQESLTFGNQTQGTTSPTQAITLTNNLSSTTLNLTGFQVSGPFTQTNNCGATLASGGTCTVNVAFAPVTDGNALGTLTVSSNTNSITVGLAGTGLGIPQAVLGTSSLSFANQPVGIASAGQADQLSNSGDASLNNLAISLTGTNASEFSEKDNCGNSLAAGASCTIIVVFAPSSTGSQTATLSISDNGANSPQQVALTGPGIAPFSISATSTSASISAGSSATYQLSVVAAQGFPLATPVTFSCAGLPQLSNCSFSPTSAAAASTTQNVTLAVSTTPASAPKPASNGHASSLGFLPFAIVGIWLLPRRRSLLRLILVAASIGALSACSGGGGSGGNGNGGQSSNPGTPSGIYTITVTASQSTTYQATQSLTLKIQ